MLFNLLIKNFTRISRKLLLGDYRQKLISKEIAKLIIRNNKKKIRIIDYGSGYFSPHIAELVQDLLKKNNKEKGFICEFLCLDLYTEREIIELNRQKKKNIKFYNVNFLNLIKKKYDYCIISDVLHHVAVNTTIKKCQTDIDCLKVINLLKKIKSKAKKIIIKDHFENSLIDRLILKTLDFMGNYHNNTPLPCKYFTKKKFSYILKDANLKVLKKIMNKSYYPKKFLFFSKPNLHFIYLTK